MVSDEVKWAKCIDFVLQHEGGFQNRADDPGNWTGGRVGKGRLVGTRYGISAASYPDLDIANMGVSQAANIYRRDYYAAGGCDLLPYPLAIILFDACVNQGVPWATRELQKVLGVVADGKIGPVTMAAIAKKPLKNIVRAFMVRRLLRYAKIDNSGWEAVWFDRIVELADEVLEDSLYMGG